MRKAPLDELKKATIIRGGEYDPSEPVKRLRIAEGRASESYEDASAQDAMAKCEEAYANNADRWQDAHQPAILVKPCALKPAACFAQKMDALTARAPLVQPVMNNKKRRRHARAVAVASTLPQPSPTPPAQSKYYVPLDIGQQVVTSRANAMRAVAALAPKLHFNPQESQSRHTSQMPFDTLEQSQQEIAARIAHSLKMEHLLSSLTSETDKLLSAMVHYVDSEVDKLLSQTSSEERRLALAKWGQCLRIRLAE